MRMRRLTRIAVAEGSGDDRGTRPAARPAARFDHAPPLDIPLLLVIVSRGIAAEGMIDQRDSAQWKADLVLGA
jgi:hypothetical protein